MKNSGRFVKWPIHTIVEGRSLRQNDFLLDIHTLSMMDYERRL